MAADNSRPSSPTLSSLVDAIQPNLAFLVIICAALIAFEFFNFSTTEHALSDMLGNLTFMGLPWSTTLSIAFCGIDFAGIARLFTPEVGADEPKEIWYLFGAWLLAATMNAILTWWGVAMAVTERSIKPSGVIDQATLINVVPIFVAIMVWVIRILIIGTLSISLDRYIHPQPAQIAAGRAAYRSTPAYQPQHAPAASRQPVGSAFSGAQPRANLTRAAAAQQRHAQPQEPTYEDENEPGPSQPQRNAVKRFN